MSGEEVTLLGSEVVAYAGDTRTKLLEALKAVERGEFDRVDGFAKEAGDCIIGAHRAQTNLLTKEASGEDIAHSVTMIYG